MGKIVFEWKGRPYMVVSPALSKVEGEWIKSIVYCSLYNNKDGEVWVRDEKDEEWEEFNIAINTSQKYHKSDHDIIKGLTVRASGRTTRMANEYIQELFAKGEVTVRDHHNNMNNHEMLARIIIGRLVMEHPHDPYIFDRTKLQIKLIKK